MKSMKIDGFKRLTKHEQKHIYGGRDSRCPKGEESPNCCDLGCGAIGYGPECEANYIPPSCP